MNGEMQTKIKKGYNLLEVKDKVQIHRFTKSQQANSTRKYGKLKVLDPYENKKESTAKKSRILILLTLQ